MTHQLPLALLEKFIAIVGIKNAITDHKTQAPYLQELRGLLTPKTPLVLRPASVEEVSAIVKLANNTNTKIVPQGGATGLVMGHIPTENTEIIVSLKRMNSLIKADEAGQYLICESGMTLLEVRQHAEKLNRHFPLSLPSEGSCTIGGNLSTNAGGTAVLAYGNTRDLILGLEVVLPNGEIMNQLRTLKKDNTGYDLRHLFIGAEGTLGIITKVVVKLFPAIQQKQLSFIGVDSPENALNLLNLAEKQAGNALTTFELMPRFGLEVVLKHGSNVRDPLSNPHLWYVLIELSSPSENSLRPLMESILEQAFEQELIQDAVINDSETQYADFWRIRHQMSETQSREGGSIKHDISVDVAKIPAFIEEVNGLLLTKYPNCRPLPFGHMGDGNLHFNISQPVAQDKQAFMDLWVEMNALVHGKVAEYGGSISAEHGIGTLKKYLLPKVKDPVSLALMKTIKATLDPKNIMNPGKVL